MASTPKNNQSQDTNISQATLAAAAAKAETDNLANRVRVHSVAKELGLKSKDFIKVLADNGIDGKVPSSTLSKQQVTDVIAALVAGGKPAETTPEKDSEKKPAAPEQEAPKQEKPVEGKPEQRKKAPKKAKAKDSKPKKTKSKPKAEAKSEKSDKAENAETKSADNTPNEAAEVASAEPVASEEKSKKNPRRRRVRRRIVRRIGTRANAPVPEAETEKPAAKAKSQKPAVKAEPTAAEIPADQLHPGDRDVEDIVDAPVRLKGSTRLESQRRWRAENRDRGRKIVSRSEFLARRESVKREMMVRDSQRSDHPGLTTQVGVVEDGQLVEHFVASDAQQSTVGNIYLGRVQNVLSSMEAAFVDIGTGRNAVLYASEMNWYSPHLHSKSRRIDQALHSGDQVLVQVMKDPVGHKGARLTNRISFAGRYLVYFPGGATAGISRKLPEQERKRLKDILQRVVPGRGGAIIRTAAENVEEDLIADDVHRLHKQWQHIEKEEAKERKSKGAKPVTLYEEPNMLIKVVRDLFNEDFSSLQVEGDKSWSMVRDYMGKMAPELMDRVHKWHSEQHAGEDVFQAHRLDDQLTKALSRKVWLPSGGYLIFDETEAMTVIDVNTGSFTGSGGNLEATVTENNLEAAEEIVRQMRLRDLGGMIVVDFIDMVLEDNQDLVLRRLIEYLGRDRTHHRVGEVTSLGLVQITRKRLGAGLLETFSTECECCGGRGVIVHADPVERDLADESGGRSRRHSSRSDDRRGSHSSSGRQPARHRDNAQDTESSDDARAHDHATRKHQDNQRDERPQREERGRQPRRVQRKHGAAKQGSGHTASKHRDTEQRDEQNDEQRGAQRGGRRVRRRVVRSSNQPSAADIAASAVRNARAEDPDEPSNEQYVAKEQRASGGKRRVRRVVRSTSRTSTCSNKTAHDNKPVRDTAEQENSQNKSTGKRRPRRGMRTVGTLGDGGPSKAKSVKPKSKAFDAAKKEFDESPRRRHRTRGHSASDVPPQEKDFGGQDTAQETQRNEQDTPRRRTRRRRVVRRSN